MNNLDVQIDSQHRAAQAAETEAQQLMARMRQIPGMESFLASGRREHGQVPNPYKTSNLTACALLEMHDAPLATYLAAAAGKGTSAPDYSRQAAEAERQAEIERLKQATADLAASNANARHQRERASIAGVNNLTGRRW
jgi:chromosome segregation ATPase